LKELQASRHVELLKIEQAVNEAAEKEITKAKKENECIVCLDAKCQVVCVPCGHYVCVTSIYFWVTV
jgi:hypothetical protein